MDAGHPHIVSRIEYSLNKMLLFLVNYMPKADINAVKISSSMYWNWLIAVTF